MWVLGIKLRSLGLHGRRFMSEPSPSPNSCIFSCTNVLPCIPAGLRYSRFLAFLSFGPSSQDNPLEGFLFAVKGLTTDWLCIQLHLPCTFVSEDAVNWGQQGQHGWEDVSSLVSSSAPQGLLWQQSFLVSLSRRSGFASFLSPLEQLASASWPNLRGRRAANGEKQLPPKK